MSALLKVSDLRQDDTAGNRFLGPGTQHSLHAIASAPLFRGTALSCTRGLIAARAALDRPVAALRPIKGTPPSIRAHPSGCRCHPRCTDVCTVQHAPPRPAGTTRAACHHAKATA